MSQEELADRAGIHVTYLSGVERGLCNRIRCGYVIISFQDSYIGHAIVAFQTDYGLKFFEPQNGNEEEVAIGRCYSAQLEGVSREDIISEIEIKWNDATTTDGQISINAE